MEGRNATKKGFGKKQEKIKIYTYELIWEEIDTEICFGKSRLTHLASTALLMVPDEIVEDVLENCLLLCPEPEEGAVYLPSDRVTGKHIIFFPYSIFDEQVDQQISTFLHEIAHFVLRHSDPQVRGTEKKEYLRNECKADKLAMTWYKEYSLDLKRNNGLINNKK